MTEAVESGMKRRGAGSLTAADIGARVLLKVGTLTRSIKKTPSNGRSSFSLVRLSTPGVDLGGEQALWNRCAALSKNTATLIGLEIGRYR